MLANPAGIGDMNTKFEIEQISELPSEHGQDHDKLAARRSECGNF
jgi:hypothetical protein